MASLRERSIFFPTEKFNGKNKALTKQHWQQFEDFCNQQKLPIEAVDDTPAADVKQIETFFQMTLTDLARIWIDRNTFKSAKDLKNRFLSDFSPYGKTHREWITKWSELKFNPDMDNIDEFIEKFEDLAELNQFPDGHRLEAFKITMPREIELHLKSINNLNDCYQKAKDLLTIIQNPVNSKQSALSLAQSRPPSPQPRSRSPSPMTPQQERSRPNFNNFSSYPGPNAMVSPRCFNCGISGHFARNCRTRPQNPHRSNFQRQITQAYGPPRVRFEEEYTSTSQGTDREWHQSINGNSNRHMQHNQGPSAPQQDEYYDEDKYISEEYYDEDVIEEYYGEDENNFEEYD